MIIPKDNLVKFMTDRWIDLMNNQKVKLGLPLFEDVYGYKRGQHVRYWADIPVLGQLYKEFFTKKLAPNNMFSFKITDDVYNQFISNVNQFIARSIFEKFVPDSFHSSASKADIDKFFSDILEVLNILTDLNFKLIHNKGSFYLNYNHGNRPTVAEEQYFIYKQFQSYQRLNVFNIKYLYQNDVPCVLAEVDVDAYGDELIHREVDEYPYGDEPIHCVEALSINMKDFSQFLLLNPNWLSTIQSSAPC